MTVDELKAPFPYFGAKSRVAGAIWERLGDPANHVDPFAGSLAVLLARPGWSVEHGAWLDGQTRIETVNDLDGLLSNAWRAIRHAPDEVAYWADDIVSECDLHARHLWLVGQRAGLTERLMGDPDYYDAKAAGWWLWGIACWIGGGWCSGNGPWISVDGRLVRRDGADGAGQGIRRQRMNLSNAGVGVHRKLVHLGDAGVGVHRKLVHLLHVGQGIHQGKVHLGDWFAALSARLRRVRICCGDWTRVLGPSPTTKNGMTAVVLDPPYAHAERAEALYAQDADIAAVVREWAIAHGDDPLLRIVLCDYGEAPMPATWSRLNWTARGGYANLGDGRGRVNRERETCWFSPACLVPGTLQPRLFDDV